MSDIYHEILENFEVAHDYLHWLTTEQYDFIKRNFVDLACNLRAFISYNAKDKKIAAVVKKAFSIIGIESFMAHEDIMPTQEWKAVIIEELKNCNLFAPIITRNFKVSDWTDQESGAAYIRGIDIIPISIALKDEGFVDPYGFIGDYQALKYRIENDTLFEDNLITRAAISMEAELSKAFIAKRNVIDKFRDCFVKSLLYSESFKESNSKVGFLDSLGPFDYNQLKMIILAYALNDQIRKAYCARSSVKTLIENNLNTLDAATKGFWDSVIDKR